MWVSGCIPQSLFTLDFWDRAFNWSWDLSLLARLSGQCAPSICLSLPPQIRIINMQCQLQTRPKLRSACLYVYVIFMFNQELNFPPFSIICKTWQHYIMPKMVLDIKEIKHVKCMANHTSSFLLFLLIFFSTSLLSSAYAGLKLPMKPHYVGENSPGLSSLLPPSPTDWVYSTVPSDEVLGIKPSV